MLHIDFILYKYYSVIVSLDTIILLLDILKLIYHKTFYHEKSYFHILLLLCDWKL